MPDLQALIEHEPEHTAFDAKLTPYTTDQHEAFLKDVVAMANAPVNGDRFIVVGLKVYPNGHRDMRGVAPEHFKDSAVYNQLVRENIEPDLRVEYTPYEFAGKTYGVFRIHDCTDQPYMMRKQFRDLERGEVWIRRGTSQSRLNRADLDRIYKGKAEEEGFTDEVRLTWEAPGDSTELEVASVGVPMLPSYQTRALILEILKRRKQTGWPQFGPIGSSLFGQSYESRPDDELRQILKELEEGLTDEDKWVLYEKLARKVNITLYNSGTAHLQDAMLEVRVPNLDGIGVADRVYSKPIYDNFGIRQFYDSPWPGYPKVVEYESLVVVRASIGDLRHHVPTPAFREPLRIVATRNAEGHRLTVSCTLHAKNLRCPRNYALTLLVISGAPPNDDEVL